MSRASNQPTGSRPQRPWYRLHASTYVAGAFVAAGLMLAELPGEVGLEGMTAEHGWPWTYLTRVDILAGDLQPKLSAWDLLRFHDRGQKPWSLETDFRPRVLAADLGISLLLLVGATAALELSRRRRSCAIQFSLRSLLVSVSLAGCGCGWWLHIDRQFCTQQAAAAALRKLGASTSASPVFPSWLTEQIENEAIDRYHRVTDVVLFPESGFCYVGIPMILEQNAAIGDEDLAPLNQLPFARRIRLDYTHLTNRGMASLQRLTRLEDLSLRSTKVSDAGLAHLAKLRSLRRLDLSYTDITDAGLVHLKQLSSLESVDLDGTRVTPEGIHRLKQALPALKATGISRTPATTMVLPAPRK